MLRRVAKETGLSQEKRDELENLLDELVKSKGLTKFNFLKEKVCTEYGGFSDYMRSQWFTDYWENKWAPPIRTKLR